MPTNRRRKKRTNTLALSEEVLWFFQGGYGYFDAEDLEADEDLARRLWETHRAEVLERWKTEGRQGLPYAVKRFDLGLSRGLSLGLRCDDSCRGKRVGCHPTCVALFK